MLFLLPIITSAGQQLLVQLLEALLQPQGMLRGSSM